MSDNDPTLERPHSDDGQTDQYPTIAGTLWPSPESIEQSADADETVDADDEWTPKGPARGIRLAVPVAATLAVVLVAAGFWGGAILQQNHGSSSGGAAAAFAARLGRTGTTGGPAAGGFPFAGGTATGSSGTTGTISVANGNTLFILTAAGALVQVTLSPSTTITRNAKTKAVDLRPGDTITVQGSTSASGTVAATSVTATAPGVSSSAGGFGSGGPAPPASNGATTPSTGG